MKLLTAGLLASFSLALFHFNSSAQAQVVRSATGAAAADIQGALDQFRSDLGVLNANGACTGPCVPGVGRREVNWDGVPDANSSPNPFPNNFFNLANGNAAGRIRGIQFSTPGTALEVSADADSDGDGNPGPVATLFGNHSPDNSDDFAAFSAERIFGVVGSNLVDVTFSKPGEPGVPALVKGFGAVFTDVELAGSTKLDFYGLGGNLLHSANVPPFVFTGGESFKSFSFLGVSFDTPVVSRVRITNGGFDLNLLQFGPDDSVAMDDFVYGEPQAMPEPAGLVAALLASIAMCGGRMRRRTIL